MTGTGFLTWRILEDDGTQLGNIVSYTSNGIGASNTIGGEFTVEQLQPASPVVSNISFTVQSSINGYTIVCEDSATMNNENLTINVLGIIIISDLGCCGDYYCSISPQLMVTQNEFIAYCIDNLLW